MEATSCVSGSSLYGSEKPGQLPKATSSRLIDEKRFGVSKNSLLLGRTSSTSVTKNEYKT